MLALSVGGFGEAGAQDGDDDGAGEGASWGAEGRCPILAETEPVDEGRCSEGSPSGPMAPATRGCSARSTPPFRAPSLPVELVPLADWWHVA